MLLRTVSRFYDEAFSYVFFLYIFFFVLIPFSIQYIIWYHDSQIFALLPYLIIRRLNYLYRERQIGNTTRQRSRFLLLVFKSRSADFYEIHYCCTHFCSISVLTFSHVFCIFLKFSLFYSLYWFCFCVRDKNLGQLFVDSSLAHLDVLVSYIFLFRRTSKAEN